MPDASGGPDEAITLRLLRVGAAPGDADGEYRLVLETTRGNIEGRFHPVEGGTSAIICVGGAMGGLDGPADGLYARLPALLAPAMVTVLRLNYRQPNALDECVADVLAGCSFLKGIGATDIALVGHSFGAAVVIKAGGLTPLVRGVAALSTQLHGTQQVHEMDTPLLLVHGMADTILSHEASEHVYRRAGGPHQMVLYSDTGHSLRPAKDEIDALLAAWLPARLAGEPMETGREEITIA